jgi:diguanylate cyclase (GGDEF)-like protein
MPYLDLAPVLARSAFWLTWLMAATAVFLHMRLIVRIRTSDRDTGMGWWLAGTLVLGSAVWAGALLTLLAEVPEGRTRHLMALVGAAWVPAVGAVGVSLWMGSQPRLHWLGRAGCALLAFGGLVLTPCLLVASTVWRPGVQWAWPAVLLCASLLTLAFASLWVWHKTLPDAGEAWVARAIGALGISALFQGAQWSLVLGLGWPDTGQSMGDHNLPPAVVQPLVAGGALIMMAVLSLAGTLEQRWRSRERQLTDSLAQAHSAIAQGSLIDPLTGLSNRAGFDHALKQSVQHSGHRVAVMLLSLDAFRSVLDLYGHDACDSLLRQVGARLRGMLRQEDLVARVEGEDFLLLVHNLGDRPAVAQLAQRVGDLVRQPLVLESGDTVLTASIGVALFPDEPQVDRLVQHAGEALQVARSGGGAAQCLYEPGMDRVVEGQVAMQRDLRHAVERGELHLQFQPKLVAATGQLAGVEALLRWVHPTRGFVSPAEFIPVAERFGLIGELGHWVLHEACRQVRAWIDAGLEIPVAVNVSVHQLRQADLPERVQHAMAEHRVPPRLLTLEITESVAMENLDTSLRMFDMLASLGVHLSIDDFGTGYSSLAYLRRLPATQLKVDRSFVRDLDDGSEGSRAIVQAVVHMAHALQLRVVAEGVETDSQAVHLLQLGCDELQGFLFARPMPPEALLAWQAERQSRSADAGIRQAVGRSSRFGDLTTV